MPQTGSAGTRKPFGVGYVPASYLRNESELST